MSTLCGLSLSCIAGIPVPLKRISLSSALFLFLFINPKNKTMKKLHIKSELYQLLLEMFTEWAYKDHYEENDVRELAGCLTDFFQYLERKKIEFKDINMTVMVFYYEELAEQSPLSLLSPEQVKAIYNLYRHQEALRTFSRFTRNSDPDNIAGCCNKDKQP